MEEEGEENRGHTTRTRVGRLSVLCHGRSGVYLLSEAFVRADCTQIVVMTIVTKKNSSNILWALFDRL